MVLLFSSSTEWWTLQVCYRDRYAQCQTVHIGRVIDTPVIVHVKVGDSFVVAQRPLPLVQSSRPLRFPVEQMAQMFGQLQQLIQQLVNQQQMFRQSLEMQRQQSQAQMGTLTNPGAAQVGKTTCDARDFQTKALTKVKGFQGGQKAWSDWRYKFRVEASRCFRQAAAILNWAEDRYDQPISESDIQQVAARENWVDMANFNMQLHDDLVSLMEECTEGFEIVRNTKKWSSMHGED